MRVLYAVIIGLFVVSGISAGESKFQTRDSLCHDTIETEEVTEPDLQSIRVRDENNRVRGIDFWASGNEPFWILEIDLEGNTKFSLHGRLDVVIETPVPSADTEKKTITYKSGENNIEIILIKENCADDMSGEKFTFNTIINLKNTVFKGCGKFLVFNKNPLLKNDIGRLNDIWALEKCMAEDVNPSVLEKGTPLLEIHLNEGYIMGNNSCNEFTGIVDADDTAIKFDRIISTKMFCPGSMEFQFMDALRKVNKWEISGMRLFLKFNEENYLVFRKID
jgi:heat shock protein HslJ